MQLRRTRFSAVALGVSLLLAPLGLLPARADQTGPQPRDVGEITLYAPPGQQPSAIAQLLVSPRTRRLYQVEETRISAFDIDTRSFIGSVVLPWQLGNGSDHTVDEAGGRIFFSARTAGVFQGVAVLDEAKFADSRTDAFTLLPLATRHPAYTVNLIGMRYEPRTDAVLMLFNPQTVVDEGSYTVLRGKQPFYANWLVQWNATSGTESWAPHLLRSCTSAALVRDVGDTAIPFLDPSGKRLNVLCGSGESGSQFVSLELDGSGAPTGAATVAAGPVMLSKFLTDPANGRTHVVVGYSNGYAVTFDWTTQRLVGSISLSQDAPGVRSGAGIDLDTGRLAFYVPPGQPRPDRPVDPGGLLLADGRRKELPQALGFRQFAGHGADHEIPVLPSRDGRPRLLLPRVQEAGLSGPTAKIRVIEDPVPVSSDPPAGDLDRTTDVDELDGKTISSFASEASGYGLRQLTVGGVFDGFGAKQNLGGCYAANRDLRFGYVERAALSSIAATAKSHHTDADLGMQADMGDLSRCWPAIAKSFLRVDPPAELKGEGPGWTPTPAECSGDDDTASGAEGSEAVATCSQQEQKVEAAGANRALQAAGVTVDHAWSKVELAREPGKGVVATSSSVAEGIDIPMVGQIGRVESVAKSWANGRTPKAGERPRAEWTVQVCGVVTTSLVQNGCDNSGAAIAALNEAGRGRVVFFRPQPDAELKAGSPKGYLSGVQREKGDAVMNRIENGDELLAVPGLEIQVRNSATTTDINRHIVQLAGVRSITTYGIAELPAEVVERPTGDDGSVDAGLSSLDQAAGGGALVTSGSAGGSKPGIVEQIVTAPGKVVKTALGLLLRGPTDSLLSFGVWCTFGVPAYLAVRRRRLVGAA